MTRAVVNIKTNTKERGNFLAEKRYLQPIGFFEHDFAKDTLWWSDEVFHILGFPIAKQPPSFEAFIQRVPKRDADRLIDLVERAEKFGKNYTMTYAYQIPQKPLKHILVKTEVVFDENKNPTGLNGAVQDITDQIRYEELINQQKEELEIQAKMLENKIKVHRADHEHNVESLMDSIPGFAFIKDSQLNYVHANSAFCNLLNIPQDEIKGKTDFDIFPEDLAKKYIQDDKKVLQTGKELMVEETTVDANKSGKRFVVATRKIPWYDTRGKLKGLYGLGFDISDLKLYEETKQARDEAIRANERLQELNEEQEILNEELRTTNEELTETIQRESKLLERLNLVMKVTSDGVFDWDLATNKVYYSPRWKEILGYEDHELPNEFSTWEQLTNSEDVLKTMEKIEAMTSGTAEGYTLTFQMKHKKGHWVDILVKTKVFCDQDHKAYRIVGTHSDISEKIKQEKEFKRLFEELKTIYHNDPTYIIIKDTENNVLKVTESVTELIGKPTHLIEGQPAKMIYGDKAEEYYQDDLEVIESKTAVKHRQKQVVNQKDGSCKWIQVDKVPILDDHNEVTGIIIFGTDITELKIAQQKAEESSQLKTEFLNNLSHEVRTPMNGILGFSSLLNNPGITEEKRKNYVSIIQNSSKQLLQILNDILEISSLETKQVSLRENEFNINEVLMDLFAIFNIKAKDKHLALYLKKAISDKPCNIVADKTKLIKILSNLLDNAIKYTHEGYVEFGYSILNEMIIFYVKDTGIGVAKENFEMIFNRFSQEDKYYSQKTGGLGLGLSISKEHAELMGGSITLESVKGEGSTFYLSIPHKSKIDFSNKIPLNDQTSNGAFTILIAEDEEINFLYLKALFEEEIKGDYTIIHAKTGKEAVEICNKNPNINLVLMDIKMPIMGGYEATHLIKEKYPKLPVIFQTAYSISSDIAEAFEHGCDDFISKPIQKTDFFRVIYKYIKIK